MLPLHGGHEGGGGNWLQRFNDSGAGVLLSGILHSVGALLFAGGIALYLYVAHSLRRAGREGGPANVGLLNYAHGFTLVGISMNGLGGLARLYETGHPHITSLASSPWVQILLVKHLFLAAGVSFAVYLTWRTRRLTHPRPDFPRLEQESRRMTMLAAASLATILLAAVFGAMAVNSDLPAADATPMSDAGHDMTGMQGSGPLVLVDSVYPGQITDPVGGQATQTSETTVPAGANRIVVVLRWGMTGQGAAADQSQLSVAARDPAGKAPDAVPSVVGKSMTLTIEGLDVKPGVWRFSVTGQQAVQTDYVLRVSALRGDGAGNFVERTVTVPVGRFFEANLIMAAQKSFGYQWEVVDSDKAIHFDIHLHPDANTVVEPVKGDWNRYAGNYTHDGSTQGPSLLWENTSGQPVTLHLRLRGDFSVHSYS